jgi:hypothetical protein
MKRSLIEMLNRHEIQVARRAGHTWAQAAKLAGVSVGPARRVAAEDRITTVDNVAEWCVVDGLTQITLYHKVNRRRKHGHA